MAASIFMRAPSFPSPTEVFSWLFEHGVEPSDCRVFEGPDGWRGSGVQKHQPSCEVCAPVATVVWCSRCARLHERGRCGR